MKAFDIKKRIDVKKVTLALATFVALCTAYVLTTPAISVTQEAASSEAGFYTQGEQADAAAAGTASQEAAAADRAAGTPGPGTAPQAAAPADTDADASAYPAQSFTETLKNEDDEVVLIASVEAPEGALPADSTLELESVKADEAKAAVEAAISYDDELAGKVQAEQAVAVDMMFKDADGDKVEPEKPVLVKLTASEVRDIDEPVLVRTLEADKALEDGKLDENGDPKEAEIVEDVAVVNQDEDDPTEGTEDTLKFETEDPGDYTIAELEPVEGGGAEESEAVFPEQSFSETVTADDGATLTVDVEAPEGALPEGAKMVVTPVIEQDVLDAAIEQAASESALEREKAEVVAADITFYDADGNQIEPQAEVHVSMHAPAIAKQNDVAVVHVDGENNAQVLESAEVDAKAATAEFDSAEFSVYALVYTVTTELVVDGKTYKITVTYDDAAGIPTGTELVASEIEPGTDEYLQHLGQAWAEVNKEYFEVEEMREHYVESMGELPDVHMTNINTARFFDITFVKDGKEIEPKAPVTVEISYDRGLYAPDGTKPGVVHYVSENEIDVIEDVDTTVSDNEATRFCYDQDSFSVVGTYVGQETRDIVTEPNLTSSLDPNGSPSSRNIELSDDAVEDIILSAAKKSGGLRAGEQEESSDNDQSKLKDRKPEGNKTLTSNNDGTYTLALSVKGHSSVSSDTDVKKSNILFVMDRSSSMITKTVSDETMRWYYGTKNTSSWRGDLTEANGYHFIGIVNGGEVDLNVSYDWWTGGSYYNPVITYTAGNTTYSYPDDAPIYCESKKTRMTAEQEALNNLFGQLLDKNAATGDLSDVVELSIISFGDERFDDKDWSDETEAGWTAGRDASSLSTAVASNRYTSGTNWEEALQYATDVILAKKEADVAAGHDDEDYYVVFLTDGEPTAVEGDSGGAPHSGDGPNGNIFAYDRAKDEAKDLVDAGIKFYNIFTYRKTEDVKYSRYLTNYAYGNGDHNNDATTDAIKNYFTDAQTPEDVVNALNNIFFTVEEAIGHANVSITDTMTTDAMTTTVVQGKTNGYTYEVKNASGDVLYTVTATGDLSNPTVTFHVPGSTQEDYLATSSEVGGKTVYSVTTAEGKTYKMALADVNDATGELTWDLSPVGMLMDDCTYSVKFIVWPDQDAYDYVAALNNSLTSITNSQGETIEVKWDEEAAHDSGKGYREGGVAKYPSIVKYEDGTFAVLTNTDQKLHYSVVETVTENGQTTTTTEGPYYSDLPLPDPMPLTASKSSIEKIWNIGRDPSALYKLLYESTDGQGNPVPYGIEFGVKQDNKDYTDVSLLGKWNEHHEYDWGEIPEEDRVQYNGKIFSKRWTEEFSIATGLMLSTARMDELKLDKSAYPSAVYEGTTYYILETGHDYNVSEPDLSYEFDFESPTYHPMLVDGDMKSVSFTTNGETTTIEKIEDIETYENGVSPLRVENTLRGYIHLKKVVVDKQGVSVPSDNTKFEFTITLHDEGRRFEGDHIPWYGINNLFYHDADFNYYQVEYVDGHLKITTESGGPYDAQCTGGTFDPNNVGAQEIQYVVDGESRVVTVYGNRTHNDGDPRKASATLKIGQGETLNIANVPNGTTYEIEETGKAGYALVGIETEVNPDDAELDSETDLDTGAMKGTIIPNHDTTVTFKNRRDVANLELFKVDKNSLDEEEKTYLKNAQFTITQLDEEGSGSYKPDPESTANPKDPYYQVTVTTDEDGKAAVPNLQPGYYEIKETAAPAGYNLTTQVEYIKVEQGTVTRIAKAENDSATEDVDEGLVKNWPENTDASGMYRFSAAPQSGGAASFLVGNEPGIALPNTGGLGTLPLYALGTLLVIVAAGILLRRYRGAFA